MKKVVLLMVALATMTAVQAKTVKKVVKVNGECEMCEKRIETAAKKCPGVISANWSPKTKKMSLVFDDKKTNEKKVMQAIAKIGYDTEAVKASTKAYNSLPACCRYRGGAAKM